MKKGMEIIFQRADINRKRLLSALEEMEKAAQSKLDWCKSVHIDCKQDKYVMTVQEGRSSILVNTKLFFESFSNAKKVSKEELQMIKDYDI